MIDNSNKITDSKIYRLFHTDNLIWLILIIAAIMRFMGLGAKSLWVDEIIASYVSIGTDLIPSWADISYIYWERFGSVSPPLRDYLTLIKYSIFGVNEFAFRLFPAIFGIAGVYLIYHICRNWFNKTIGLWSAFLMTITPFPLEHSQDGRMYTLIIFFSFISFYFLYKSFYAEKRQVLYWIGFTLGNTIGIYLSYFGFWALITQLVVGLFWIIQDSFKKDNPFKFGFYQIGKICIALSFMLNFYIPWIYSLLYFLRQHIHAPIPYQIPFIAEEISEEQALIFRYHLTPNWEFLKSLLSDFGVPGIGLYIYIILTLIGIYTLFKLDKKITIGLLLWFLVPLVITFAPPAKALFFNRYISFILPVYLIFIAAGLWKSTQYVSIKLSSVQFIQKYSAIYLTGIIIILILNIPYIYNYYTVEKQNWRGAVEYLLPRLETGDIIIAGPHNAFWCVLFYSQQNGADRGQIIETSYGGKGALVYFPGKTVAFYKKINRRDALIEICNDFPRVWYISAYYRTYQYRTSDYYDFIEKNFPEVVSFPANKPDNTIYIFFRNNPMVQPDPNIIWPIMK